MSRNWLAGLLATFVLISTVQAADPADSLLAGDAAVTKFDLATALTAYRSALKAAPDNYEATWKLGRTLLDQGTLLKDRDAQKPVFIEAEQLIRHAVQLNPKDSKGHLYLSMAVGNLALFEGGKKKVELSKEIKTEADKAVELNPKEDLALHVIGVWNREMAELNWMLRKFAEVLYGSFPPASLETAEADLKQAAKLAPSTVAHQVELGITQAAAGRWTEAKATLEEALKMPKTWVTDDHYKAKATAELERVKSHL